MWKFITGNIKEFWRGTFAFSFTGFGFVIFQKIIILDLFLGIMVTVLSGALGGMATALGTHYYKHHIHNKIFKNKKDGDKEKDKAA